MKDNKEYAGVPACETHIYAFSVFFFKQKEKQILYIQKLTRLFSNRCFQTFSNCPDLVF